MSPCRLDAGEPTRKILMQFLIFELSRIACAGCFEASAVRRFIPAMPGPPGLQETATGEAVTDGP